MDEEISVRLDSHRNLLLTEISRRTFEEQSLMDDLDSDCGLFVVIEDTIAGTFDVLAKVASASAGRTMIELFTRAGQRLHAV